MSSSNLKPNSSPRIFSSLASTLGFTHFFNFILFLISGGALFAFILARLPYLSFSSGLCPAGGGALDCYNYTPGSIDKTAIMIHLFAVLPAAGLAILQFIPKVRRRFIAFHRINGYIIQTLAIISTAGAFLLGPNIVGGEISAQLGTAVLGVVFLGSMGLAWWNVRKLQIEQHRAWMLRAWFYAGAIVTMRPLLVFMIIILGLSPWASRSSAAMPCAKIAYFYGGSLNATMARHPECGSYFAGEDPDKFAVVKMDLRGDPPNVMALVTSVFGTSLWLALAIHAVGVEIYLHLTPAEAERLRNISYKRQLQAGMKTPGRMGLTADKLGHAVKWAPRVSRVQAEPESVPVHVAESSYGSLQPLLQRASAVQ